MFNPALHFMNTDTKQLARGPKVLGSSVRSGGQAAPQDISRGLATLSCCAGQWPRVGPKAPAYCLQSFCGSKETLQVWVPPSHCTPVAVSAQVSPAIWGEAPRLGDSPRACA